MAIIFAVEPPRIKGRKPRVLTAGHVVWIGLEVQFLWSGCRMVISQNCAACIGTTCEPLQNQATGRRRTLLERRKYEKKMQCVANGGGEPEVFIFISCWCTITPGAQAPVYKVVRTTFAIPGKQGFYWKNYSRIQGM